MRRSEGGRRTRRERQRERQTHTHKDSWMEGGKTEW